MNLNSPRARISWIQFPINLRKSASICGSNLPLPIAFAALLLLIPAAHAETALDALKQLPADQSARVARIEGRDGAPEPDRWYILTQDPAADNGVHEFVVSKGAVIASRSISQFADNLKPEDMLGNVDISVDSDKAAQLAHDYAVANRAAIATINYELKRDAPGAPPVWTLSCLDANSGKLGVLVITAGKGNIVSHDGFPLDPPPPTPIPKKHRPKLLPKPTPAPPYVPPGDQQTQPQNTASPMSRTIDKFGRSLQKLLPF